MSCSMRLNPVRYFAKGADAHAWRTRCGLPKCSMHFSRTRGWRMQLHLNESEYVNLERDGLL